MLDVLNQIMNDLTPLVGAQKGSWGLATQTVIGRVEPSFWVKDDLSDLA